MSPPSELFPSLALSALGGVQRARMHGIYPDLQYRADEPYYADQRERGLAVLTHNGQRIEDVCRAEREVG